MAMPILGEQGSNTTYNLNAKREDPAEITFSSNIIYKYATKNVQYPLKRLLENFQTLLLFDSFHSQNGQRKVGIHYMTFFYLFAVQIRASLT